MKRSHLTLDERYLIHACLVARFRPSEMASECRRSYSAIYMECRRGANAAGIYCPHRGQRKADAARARSVANAPAKSAEFWQHVGTQLKGGHSPEQISGRRKLLGVSATPTNPATPSTSATPATLANISIQAIYDAVKRYGWRTHLYSVRVRRRLKRPASRPYTGRAKRIAERAAEVLTRIKLGDWEADCALGKKRDRQRTIVLVERQSLYEQLVLLPRCNAKLTAKLIAKALACCGLPFNSVATDRGSEFAAMGDVFPDKAYVCDAYQPNQRGTNENQIGRLRADLPKGASMDSLTQAKLNKIQHKHNHTPRKCLGFLTPYEVAFNCPPLLAFRT